MATSEKPKLKKTLSLLETIGVGVSDISPVTGLFVMFPVLIATTGTGSLTVMLLAGLIALCVALTMGELGSMFPDAGGIYSIIRRVLGKTTGFLSLILYLSQGIFIPAVVALGAATYINNLFPSFNLNIIAMVVMLTAAGVAVINISAGAKFTSFLLVLELGVVGIMTVAAFIFASNSPTVLFDMEVASADGSLTKVTPAILFAAVSVMLFSYNGYDSALTLSEENAGEPKDIGKSVFRTALTGVLAQIIPAIAIILAAPSIIGLLTANDPMAFVGHSILGNGFDLLINIGAAIAMFACTIAVILQFSRVLYASGRNNAWPKKISNAFSALHPKFQTPWISALVLGILGAILVLESNLENLVTFTSVIVVSLYALVAICSFIIHMKHNHLKRPYKIPLWPLAPAIALIGSVATLTQQSISDLIVVLCILAVSAIYYIFYLRKREKSIGSETE